MLITVRMKMHIHDLPNSRALSAYPVFSCSSYMVFAVYRRSQTCNPENLQKKESKTIKGLEKNENRNQVKGKESNQDFSFFFFLHG